MSPDDIPLLFRTPRRVPRKELRRYLGELAQRVVRGRTIACLIADDAEIRRQWSFCSGGDQRIRGRSGYQYAEGETADTVDRARVQAAERGHSLADELRILMLHGALHLAGMDHETDSGEMARAEVRWRKRLGLHGGLIERARSGGNAKKATA